MRSPIALLMLTVAMTSAPALARHSADDDLGRAARQLADPARQQQIAQAAGDAVNAVLSLPVGPLLRADAEIAGDDPRAIDPDTRVGDLAGPAADDARREVTEGLPRMASAMADLANAVHDMIPQFRAMGERLDRDLDRDWAGHRTAERR